MSTPDNYENRRFARIHKSEVTLWKPFGQDLFRTACTLEASPLGMAFAWRGTDVPQAGNLLEVQRDQHGWAEVTQAVVRRAAVVHDDLAIIAVEFTSVQPFPAPSVAYATIESKAAGVRPLFNSTAA